MNRVTCFLRLAALVFTLQLALTARAEHRENGTILLIVDTRARALATRVAAELEALGFFVLTRAQEPRAAQLSDEARSAGAMAAIWIGPTAEGSVEITLLDRVTGKIVRREVLGPSLEDPTMRELVALRASELLRASLMEIEAPHPPRGDVPASANVNKVVSSASTSRRQSRRLMLEVESGVLLVPGLSAAPLLQLSASTRATERLALGFGFGGQLTSSSRAAAHGRIEALARWLGAGAELLLLPPGAETRVALGIDVQALLVALSAQGTAADALDRGQSGLVWIPAARVGLAARVRLSQGLWWTLEPTVAVTAAKIALRVDGQELQAWGRPWLAWSSGLELELP